MSNTALPEIVHNEAQKRFQTEDGNYFLQYKCRSSAMETIDISAPPALHKALYDAANKYATDNNLTVTHTSRYNFRPQNALGGGSGWYPSDGRGKKNFAFGKGKPSHPHSFK